MALLNILHFPDPRLHKIAKPIAQIDARIRQLAADMAETMYASHGVGLAATQIDVHERLIVIDVSETADQLLTLINPEIIWASADTEIGREGCLSVPEIFDNVARATHIKVRALNLEGNAVEFEAEGLLAICVQHEIDHLQGKVFVEYLSPLKQTRVKNKLKKQARQAS